MCVWVEVEGRGGGIGERGDGEMGLGEWEEGDAGPGGKAE